MARYKIEFVEKYPPYQLEDEWHLTQYWSQNGLDCGIVRYIGKTKKECEDKLKELKKDRG